MNPTSISVKEASFSSANHLISIPSMQPASVSAKVVLFSSKQRTHSKNLWYSSSF